MRSRMAAAVVPVKKLYFPYLIVKLLSNWNAVKLLLHILSLTHNIIDKYRRNKYSVVVVDLSSYMRD